MTDFQFTLKLMHVLGAALLFGGTLCFAFFLWKAHATRNASVIAYVVDVVAAADKLFVATAMIVLPVSGLMLVQSIGYSLWESWMVVSLGLYVLIGLCWLPMMRIEARLRDLAKVAMRDEAPLPEDYPRLFRAWSRLGGLAVFALIVSFVVMIWRPLLW